MSVGKNRVLTESCWVIPIISMNMNKVIQIHTDLCAPASAVSFFELFDPVCSVSIYGYIERII
jgi:hypothetical protein